VRMSELTQLDVQYRTTPGLLYSILEDFHFEPVVTTGMGQMIASRVAG
jgi:hypothetical protein